MSYLEKARARLKHAEPKPEYRLIERPSTDATEGRVIPYLIASEVLGCDIWFAFDDSFETHDGLAVFYSDEILFLKDKGPETLRAIHKTKMKFPGSRVKQ